MRDGRQEETLIFMLKQPLSSVKPVSHVITFRNRENRLLFEIEKGPNSAVSYVDRGTNRTLSFDSHGPHRNKH
jgi:hypothetical protein